jgi:hypothetical protein
MPAGKGCCPGCRAVEGHCPVIINEQCATWLCSKEKGMEFCSECIDFPCAKLMPCSDRADKLPHNIKAYSLALRKARGAHEWENLIRKAYDLYSRGQMVIGQGPRPKAGLLRSPEIVQVIGLTLLAPRTQRPQFAVRLG